VAIHVFTRRNFADNFNRRILIKRFGKYFMRRYAFYLAAGFLTSSVSIFALFPFSFWKINQTESEGYVRTARAQTLKDYTADKKNKQPEFVSIKLKNLPCEHETLLLVWNNLTDETASINIERAAKIKNCSDILEVLEFDKPFDLDNDGNEEIIIRGIENPYSRCGNNCYTYWIFQKTGEKKYLKLFEAEGYLPIVENKKTKGYKDLIFEVFARYSESGNILYQFNGKEYIPKRCWSDSNLYKNNDGDLVEGKKRKTRYYKCEKSGYITNYRHHTNQQ
jgi:hypothetical protein